MAEIHVQHELANKVGMSFTFKTWSGGDGWPRPGEVGTWQHLSITACHDGSVLRYLHGTRPQEQYAGVISDSKPEISVNRWCGGDGRLDRLWCCSLRHGSCALMAECCSILRADSRFAPSQWERTLQSNAVSHWLGANLESALTLISCNNKYDLLWLKLKPQGAWGLLSSSNFNFWCCWWFFLKSFWKQTSILFSEMNNVWTPISIL